MTGEESDLARAVGAWERFGAWCTAVGMVGIGALVYVGPAGIAEEIPPHRAVGIGFAVFGGLFVLALVLRGGAGLRVRSLLLSIAMALLGALFGLGAWNEGRIVHGLATAGEPATVRVVSSTPNFSDSGARFRIVVQDGARRRTIGRDSSLGRGTTLDLLVHPDHAGWTAEAEPGTDWLGVAEARGTQLQLLGFSAAAVVLALVALAFLFGAFSGRPPIELDE